MTQIQEAQLACRYRISLPSTSTEIGQIVARNTVSTEIDLINRRVVARIRETVTGDVANAIGHLCRYQSTGLSMHALPGDLEQPGNFRMDFLHATIVGHRCCYDYASEEPAMHEISWTFTSFSVFSPNDGPANNEKP